MSEAATVIDDLLERPQVRFLQPGERHWTILRKLLLEGQVSGSLVMDAHLAALAIEHGALLCTTDRDFSRFPGLRWENPLEKT
jgi:predicted nucleic acid-binding protein